MAKQDDEVLPRSLSELEFEGPAAPEDSGNEAYYIFFLLGTGFLLPWNAFITAIDYFSFLYPTQHVDTVFSVAYMIPNLVLLVFLILYLGQTPPRTRILGGFFAYFLLVALVPFLDAGTVGSDGLGTTLSFALTVLAVAFSGVVDALIQGSLFGLAAELPPLYTQAVTAGVSASGIITSGLRITTKLLFPDTEWGLQWSAYLYFIISAGVLLVCVWAYRRLNSLPLLQRIHSRRSFTALATDAVPFLDSDGASVSGQVGSIPSVGSSGDVKSSAPLMETSGSAEKSTLSDDEKEQVNGTGTVELQLAEPRAAAGMSKTSFGFLAEWFYLDALVVEGKAMSIQAGPSGKNFQVLGVIWPYAASLTLVYFVTLSIFPGFISELKADALGSWYPVLLMAAFNLFDFLGKMTPVIFVVENDGLLFAMVIGRFLFYPLYSACMGTSASPFVSQTAIPILTSILGFSNGLLTSLLMMAAPAVVPDEQAEATGTVMVLFLVIGLTMGAIGAYFWVLLHI